MTPQDRSNAVWLRIKRGWQAKRLQCSGLTRRLPFKTSWRPFSRCCDRRRMAVRGKAFARADAVFGKQARLGRTNPALRWRKADSNPWSLLHRRRLRDRPWRLGRLRVPAGETNSFTGGTHGSNPLSSSGESDANLFLGGTDAGRYVHAVILGSEER